MTDSGQSMWGGRFTGDPDLFMQEFGASIDVDIRLLEVDIAGSRAWAEALGDIGILTVDEVVNIQIGLSRVLETLKQQRDEGSAPFDRSLEDVHMTVEATLTELIGDLGAKLHTGRSRNDQVALDERLYLLVAIPEVMELIAAVQHAILTRAEEHIDTVVSSYTHLQQAQPVRLAHHLMAWFWMLDRDMERFADALYRTDRMPLGSGAVAGSGFAVNRELLAESLGFTTLTENSIDATSDRDYIIETISAASLLMMHLSRIAEELIIWSSAEFGYVTLPDAYATGSSMMPQKKNPDSLELVRGKTGRVYGNLMGILTVMKGLPFSYGKDMQEDKEPLFDTLATIDGCLRITAGVIGGSTFHADRMAAAIDPSVLATDIADDLVKEQGIPFRQAHRMAGEKVKAGELADQVGATPEEQAALYRAAADRRTIAGGTGIDALKQQIEHAKQRLAGGEDDS